MKTLFTLLLVVVISVMNIQAQSMGLDSAENVLQSAIDNRTGLGELLTTIVIIDGHRITGITVHDNKVIKAAVIAISMAKQAKHNTGFEYYEEYVSTIFKRLMRSGVIVREL